MENLSARDPKRLRAALRAFAGAAAACLCLAAEAAADRMVLKDGQVIFGTVTDEKDSLIRYFDRYDRPRKIEASRVDTLNYDSRGVRGRVKVAFRKGQTRDRSGWFRIRHSEELDLEVEYRTDSTAELDLFFRNEVHIRVLPNSHFQVAEAPKDADDPLVFELKAGRIIATSPQAKAVVRAAAPGGIGVGRGAFQAGISASPSDSSLQVLCLRGLVGVQENARSPGELVVEPGESVGLTLKEGVYDRRAPDPEQDRRFRELAANMGRYRFSPVQYPGVGYLPKALTGLGFMVFFYGTAIGILDYVNHI